MASVASVDSVRCSEKLDQGLKETKGVDSDGVSFSSISEMWTSATAKGLEKWYGWGIEYYKKQKPTIDGALGGLGDLTHAPDVEHSKNLLKVWTEERISLLGKGKPDPDVSSGSSEATRPTARAHASSIAMPLARTRALDLGGGMGRVSAAVLS